MLSHRGLIRILQPFALGATLCAIMAPALALRLSDSGGALENAVPAIWLAGLVLIGVVGRGLAALLAALSVAVLLALFADALPPTQQELADDHCSPDCLEGALVTGIVVATTLSTAGMAARRSVVAFGSGGPALRARLTGMLFACAVLAVLVVGYAVLDRLPY